MTSRVQALDEDANFPGWWQVALALVISGQAMMVSLGLNTTDEPPAFGSFFYWGVHGLMLGSALLAVLLLGGPLYRNLLRSWREKRLTIESLFVVSLLGALVVSLQSTLTGSGPVYYEVVSLVVVIYTFGNSLRANAAREAQKILKESRESYAYAWVQAEGELRRVPLASLTVESLFVVKPGELVPVDGVVQQGRAFVSLSSINGEPLPVAVQPGDTLPAGAFSVDGLLTVRVGSTARSIDAIFAALGQSAPSVYQQLADQVTRWFLPVVGGIAAITFVVWTLISGVPLGITNAMSVLLVACPCALGIATPLGVQSFLYALARDGWRARSGQLVERLAQVDTVFFDKTGTLTFSNLKISKEAWLPLEKLSPEEIRGMVALAEQSVNQPIALAFAAWQPLAEAGLASLRVHPGEGVSAEVSYRGATHCLFIGRKEFLLAQKIPVEQFSQVKSLEDFSARQIFVGVEGCAAGVVTLSEDPRPQMAQMLERLLQRGLRVEVLTGDAHPQIDFDPRVKVHAGLSPQQKAKRVADAQQAGARVLFIGDGINDALAINQAFCSVAIAEGAPLSHAAALAVVSGTGLEKLPEALATAQSSSSALRWNLQFAAIYNMIGILLASMGILHPVVASLLMLSSSVVVAWRAMAAVQPPVQAAGP